MELTGIASGSNKPVESIVLLNALLDLINLRHELFMVDPAGCTVVAVAPPATAGQVYLGQTYDLEEAYRPYVGYAVIKPKFGPKATIMTLAGVLGCTGVNEDGLGLAINHLHTSETSPGVMYPFVVRHVLAQRRIGDAIGAVTIARRASGMHYLVANKDGIIVSIETTSSGHEVVFADSGYLVHANHYCQIRFKASDLAVGIPSYSSTISRRGSTLVRQHVAENDVKAKLGEFGLSDLFSTLRSHTNHPFGICCHGDQAVSSMYRGSTITSFVFDLTADTIYASNGAGHSDFTPLAAERTATPPGG